MNAIYPFRRSRNSCVTPPSCDTDAERASAKSDALLLACREYLAMMTEEQIDRYEAFRRSSLQKAAMRKVRIAKPLFTPYTEALSLAQMPQGAAADIIMAGHSFLTWH
jgi:hypothetical protein